MKYEVPVPNAEWVFHSGAVFDGRRLVPGASAVAVSGGVVTAVGSDDELRAWSGPSTQAIDLAGRLVSPGFTDAHVHAAYAGVERLGCDLAELSGARACLDRIREHAALPPEPGNDAGWITGGGWYKGDFPGGYPGTDLLDAVVPDRPVYLINRDHHSAWVNSRALELAGITASTPDPADGRIERHADGTPSGTLHEGAMELLARVLPEVTDAQLEAGILHAQDHLFSVGVTGWQEAILGHYGGYPDASAAYRSLAAAGKLTARATGALWIPRSTTVETVPALVESLLERRKLNDAAGFSTRSAKIMVDGVPENCTAAMLEDYLRPCACAGPEPSGERGLLYLSPEVLHAVSAALDAAGFDLHMHVIGDRAVRTGLDAVAAARSANPGSAGRHHMAHLQIIHPDDVARFAALDVTVNAQALWACNDDQMTELTVPLLGPERAAWQYPFAGLAAAGARLAMGSDWPVSSPDPWQAIHVAVNRAHPDYPDAPALLPDQAISLQAAMAAYTSGSAWLNRSPGGSLVPGAPADLAVHSANPFDLPRQALSSLRVDLAMVAGSPVFDRAATASASPLQRIPSA
ncbi:amidohydrolase [Arthrobacter caoxuetaonis]|uniref:amidohydrolase n=1 Tax=Arthrobacter caoxuetaonis TaxID=2886935 RepID=UPI001D1375CA|nr:amidohydrolase [Arthrobacter caoxuetaonis]MCC3282185.1 amidohydrolase [Arthrobacter caoxuetaonis]